MKGITGHRIHDAYASMASRKVAGARSQVEETQGPKPRTQPEAAAVNISDGARRLAQGQGTSDAARLDELRKKAEVGPSAFDSNIVAERMLAEFAG